MTNAALVDATNHKAPERTQLTWDSAENLRRMLESAPVAVVTVDRHGRILYANQKLEELFGFSREELLGQDVEALMPESVRAIHRTHRASYVKQPRMRPMGNGLNLTGRRKDGSEFPLEAGLNFITVEQELLVIASIVDITVRKQAAEMLEQRVEERTRELERRRRVADGLRDILAVLNSEQNLQEILSYIVAQAGMLLGAHACAIFRVRTQDGLLRIQVSQGLPDAYLALANITPSQESVIGRVVLNRQIEVVDSLASILPTSNPEVYERNRTLLQSGLHGLLCVPLLVKSDVYGVLALYYADQREVTQEEIDLAVTFGDQAALAIENARLRAQAEEAAIVAERSRIARDLHDSVTQTLFAANIIAEVLPRIWQRNVERGQQKLEELHELTRGALAEMRTLLLELRPNMLPDAHLSELLRQLVDATIGRARVPVTLEIYGECNALPKDIRIALYRITQEALNNVAKHARATRVVVTVVCGPDQTEVTIHDDGVGFHLDTITGDHLGLAIMHERAEETGAVLTIHAAPDHGTVITALWCR